MFTDKFDVYRSEWLELVFANRNHEYGAYELRKNYSSTLNKALITASVLFITAVCLPVILHNINAKDGVVSDLPVLKSDDEGRIIDMSQFVKRVPPSQAAPAADPVKIKTTRFVPPRVVSEEKVREEMPNVETLAKSTIASKTQEGVDIPSDVSPVLSNGKGGEGSAFSEGGEGSGESTVFESVERFPEFPGGAEGFSKYLRKNLRYPASAVENGITGRVYLSFIVEKDGSLTDIKVIKGIGFGCDEEAVRVLKKSPAWSPGIQNKQRVRVQYTLPLVFSLGE